MSETIFINQNMAGYSSMHDSALEIETLQDALELVENMLADYAQNENTFYECFETIAKRLYVFFQSGLDYEHIVTYYDNISGFPTEIFIFRSSENYE